MTSPFDVLGAAASARPGLGSRRYGSGLRGLSEADYSIIGRAPIGTRIQKLCWAVTMGRHDPGSVEMIRDAAAKCHTGDDRCVLCAGLDELRAKLRYRSEDPDVDRYPPYSLALDLVEIDCSGMAAAMATFATVMGIPSSVCTIMQLDQETGETSWNHVYNVEYPRIGIRGTRQRVPVDVSEPGTPVNWEPQAWRARARREWVYCARAWDAWYAAGADPGHMPPAE